MLANRTTIKQDTEIAIFFFTAVPSLGSVCAALKLL